MESFGCHLAAFPTGSDFKKGDSSTVFIVKGERVSSRGVVVKAIEGDQVEVESGLMKDDRVVACATGRTKGWGSRCGQPMISVFSMSP
jgi:multidrug efflux pump subunit AcrA (membrane-fusion protein)